MTNAVCSIMTTCLLASLLVGSGAFHTVPRPMKQRSIDLSRSRLGMGLDLVTYLRTEYVSAALCTNQTPRAANVCLQLGVEDGRAITFVPRTIRRFVTSTSAVDGQLSVSARRQLRQQVERRGTDVEIDYVDQPSDDLRDTPDDSVDVVLSLQAAATMQDHGLDWKKSVQEAARVLKPGGRLLFVEQTDLEGDNYADYVRNLGVQIKTDDSDQRQPPSEPEVVRIFDDVGTDDVDLVLVPHIAGVAIKAEDANLTTKQRKEKVKNEQKDKYDELAISVFERGLKKRKRKKKKDTPSQTDTTTAAQ